MRGSKMIMTKLKTVSCGCLFAETVIKNGHKRLGQPHSYKNNTTK